MEKIFWFSVIGRCVAGNQLPSLIIIIIDFNKDSAFQEKNMIQNTGHLVKYGHQEYCPPPDQGVRSVECGGHGVDQDGGPGRRAAGQHDYSW